MAVLNLEIQTLHTLLHGEDGYVVEWTELWLGLPQAHQLALWSFECREMFSDRWVFRPVWFRFICPSVRLSVYLSVGRLVSLLVVLRGNMLSSHDVYEHVGSTFTTAQYHAQH